MPAMELMNVMLPRRASTICGRKISTNPTLVHRLVRKTPPNRLRRDASRSSPAAAPDITNDRVDSAPPLHHLPVRFLCHCGLAEVAGEGHDTIGAARRKLGARGDHRGRIAAGDDSPCSFLQEHRCDAFADSPRRAGHEYDFVLQSEIHLIQILLHDFTVPAGPCDFLACFPACHLEDEVAPIAQTAHSLENRFQVGIAFP